MNNIKKVNNFFTRSFQENIKRPKNCMKRNNENDNFY